MVTFRLVEDNRDQLIYLYYPEGNESKRPGRIEMNRTTHETEIVELAEEDWEYTRTAEELNAMAESINQTARTRGDTDFVPMTERDELCVYYGDHAVRELIRRLQKGEIPQSGMQAWY